MTPLLVIAVFEFASPWALGWLGAAALPWLVNLWNRRRHVDMPWAAVDLLLAAIRERSRRLRWREWLLVAMRTAILVLAALAAAQPVWRSTASAGALVGRTHRVFVIDHSFSMGVSVEGATRLDRAKERVRKIIHKSPAGDAFTVIAWGQSADNVAGRPMFEAGAALAALDSIKISDGVATLPVAVRAVEAAFDAVEREFQEVDKRHVVSVSDMTRNTWAAALPPASSAPEAALSGQETARAWQRLGQRASLLLEDIDDGVRNNLAIVDVAVDPASATLDSPLAVGVRVQATGGRAGWPVEVTLLLDGHVIGRQTIEPRLSEAAVARFETQIIEAGSHVFEARLQNGVDALNIDDIRWLAVDSRPASRVICFLDVPGAADDIARAIDPQRGRVAVSTLGVNMASMARLASTDLSEYEAVLLCNVAELAPREQGLLRSYIAGGGATLFVLGGRTRIGTYNDFFGAVGGGRTLSDDALMSIELRPDVTGDWRLDPLEYRHPILAPFAGRSRAGLAGVRVSRYFPASIKAEANDAQTALAFSSGDPAIVINDYGLGRVAVLTTDPALTGAGEPWSTLAVSPSFLPLVRELISFLAANRRVERLNRTVGQSISAPHTSRAGDERGHWKTPDGKEISGPISPSTGAIEAKRRGVYEFVAEHTTHSAAPRNEQKHLAAVNVNSRESDLTTIDPQDLSSTMASAAVAQAAIGRAAAVPLQRSLLIATLFVLLLELLIAWLMGRGWG